MAMYARVEEGIVAELIDTGGYAITELFAPEFLTSMVPVPEGVDLELGAEVRSIEQTAEPLPAPETPAVLSAPDTLNTASEDPVTQERQWRSASLAASQWLAARHRDEQDLGRGTTLTAQQYLELLEHRQALREWPASSHFPEATARPEAPHWLAGMLSWP